MLFNSVLADRATQIKSADSKQTTAACCTKAAAGGGQTNQRPNDCGSALSPAGVARATLRGFWFGDFRLTRERLGATRRQHVARRQVTHIHRKQLVGVGTVEHLLER